MTVASSQILVFYILGIVMFILSMDEDETPKNFIYIGMTFLINLMAYYLSYKEADYVSTAYLPLVLVILVIIIGTRKTFDEMKQRTDDDYSNDEE